MIRTIHLHGALAEKYGEQFNLAVETPAEAVRALCSQLRGFERDIRAGEWVCVRGDKDDGVECDSDLLKLNFGRETQFHLIPAAIGRSSEGRANTKIVIGIILIIAAFWTGGTSLYGFSGYGAGAGAYGGIGLAGVGGVAFNTAAGALAFGAGALLILSGAAMLLSPAASGVDAGAEDAPGYLFNGASNTNTQGGSVPVVFGRVRAGSVVVSAGISTERITFDASYGETSGTPTNDEEAGTPAGTIDYTTDI